MNWWSRPEPDPMTEFGPDTVTPVDPAVRLAEIAAEAQREAERQRARWLDLLPTREVR